MCRPDDPRSTSVSGDLGVQRRRDRRRRRTQLLSYGWEALDLARVADDEELLVMTLKLLGDVVATGGDPTTGLTLLEEAAALTPPGPIPGGERRTRTLPGGAPISEAT